MEEKDIFTPNHERLSSIAYWTKFASRPVLFLGIGYAVLMAVGNYTNQIQYYQVYQGLAPDGSSLSALDYLEIALGLAYGIMKGIFYYLVLRGVSLGLDMIVETDINYREKEVTGGINE